MVAFPLRQVAAARVRFGFDGNFLKSQEFQPGGSREGNGGCLVAITIDSDDSGGCHSGFSPFVHQHE